MTTHPRPSARVTNALQAGYMSACEGAAAIASSTYEPRAGAEPYHLLIARAGDREVQISISPTGSSVRVFVDGTEAPAVKPLDRLLGKTKRARR